MIGINKEALKKRLRSNLENNMHFRDNTISQNHSRNYQQHNRTANASASKRGSTISNIRRFRNDRLILDASSHASESKQRNGRVI